MDIIGFPNVESTTIVYILFPGILGFVVALRAVQKGIQKNQENSYLVQLAYFLVNWTVYSGSAFLTVISLVLIQESLLRGILALVIDSCIVIWIIRNMPEL